MASLVADYGSDSEKDNDSDDICSKEERNETIADQKAGNFFEQHDSSSISDADSDEESKDCDVPKVKQPSPQTQKLPNPLAMGKNSKLSSSADSPATHSETAKHSVFVNPFQKAEEAKLSVLEQHVKMTNEVPQGDNQKKVCRSFMKGKCRFGNKCKYSHSKGQVNTVNAESDSPSGFKSSAPQHNYYGQQSYHGGVEEEVDDDSYMGQVKRKRRSGINDHLRPPSKAMKNLNEQRSKERPWTLNN